MSESESCECPAAPTLVFACSGAADVGEISDLAARKLTRDGVGNMFCLAGVGGQVAPIVEKTRAAQKILAIDGCALDCVRKTLELANVNGVRHFRVTDLGMKKGETPVTTDRVAEVAEIGRGLLSNGREANATQ